MKKLGIFLVVVLLAPSLALELALTAEENTKTLVLEKDKRAIYELSIKNLGEANTFNILIENGFALRLSGILVNPETSSVRLESGESKEIRIYVSILEKALPGSYQIMVIAESDGEKSYYPLNLELRTLEPVVLKLSKDPSYKPTNIKIGVGVFNALDKEIQDLLIRFEIDEMKRTIALGNIGAKETLNKTVTFSLPPTTGPGRYLATASIGNRKEYIRKKFWLKIAEYKPPLKVERSSQMKPDGYYTSFAVKNPGNVPRTARKEIKVTKLISWLFKPITPPSKVAEEKQIVYHWAVELEPGETKSISYKFWYLPLYIIAIAVGGILYFGYQYTLTPVITKQVVQKESIEKPSESRAILTITNRSNRKLKQVTVKDLIPLVSRDLKDYGTIEPKKTVKTDRGRLLVWELKSLDPKEERILSYKMKNVLGVIGGLRLPKAGLYYKVNGRERKRYSNIARLK